MNGRVTVRCKAERPLPACTSQTSGHNLPLSQVELSAGGIDHGSSGTGAVVFRQMRICRNREEVSVYLTLLPLSMPTFCDERGFPKETQHTLSLVAVLGLPRDARGTQEKWVF